MTAGRSGLRVQRLRVEGMRESIGLGVRTPRFSWQLVSELSETVQEAVAIRVVRRNAPEVVVWDSGRIDSAQSIHFEYGGEALESRGRYQVVVKVWDNHNRESEWSSPAPFEMGLLHASDVVARWIEPEGEIDPNALQPSPLVRRSFSLAGSVESARLYITSHGLYRATINGVPVGTHLFAPGWTSYHRRLQYQTYDVTHLLSAGENVVGVVLGDGWWRGEVGPESHRNTYGEKLALLAQLEIELSGAERVIVGSDASWRTAVGPIVSSDLQDGEVYDARRHQNGWDRPSFDDSHWSSVHEAGHELGNLIAQDGPPVVRCEELSVQEVITTPDGQTVLDFGQNISGVVRFTLAAPAGTTITLRHREVLTTEGNLAIEDGTRIPILGVYMPAQKNTYTFSGDGPETYEPFFATAGFRYVGVEGFPGDLDPDAFTAIAIYSEMETLGEFSCSDERVNGFHRNVLWSQKGNFMDIPTDCPTRERAGWTGDAQIFARTACTLMDSHRFLAKWLRDVAADQAASGSVPGMIPAFYEASGRRHLIFSGTSGSSGWGDAAVIIPWTLYQVYGDRRVLEEQYPSMLAWMGYIQEMVSKVNWRRRFTFRYLLSKTYRKNLRVLWDTGFHFGEWLEPDVSMPKLFAGVIKSFLVSNPVVASAYYKHSLDLMAEIARVLGRDDESATYRDQAQEVARAYGEVFVAADGRIKPDRQASYVRALAFGLVPHDRVEAAVGHLVRLIEEADDHLGTGFLSSGMLLGVLADHGRLDVAYRLLKQETPPSWLYSVRAGATTMWEGWESIATSGEIDQGSHNHYSKGAVVEWFYRAIAGIDLDQPGYKEIRFAPRPGGGLTHARAVVRSSYGPIRSEWTLVGDRFELEVDVPANTTANILLPDGSDEHRAGSGTWRYTCEVKT